ncbi:MAG: phage tail tube protein [Prevotellaceae bacterium]|nr:phage tail tube protein [Prevotellaceae bacterium]
MVAEGNYNFNPISLREGKIFMNGTECADGVVCKIDAALETWQGRVLGDRTPSTRVIGVSYTVTVTQMRSTPWLADAIAEYEATGIMPETTIQGIQYDPGSDYGIENGSKTVTAVGCIPTGTVTILNIDATGDVFKDELTFAAKELV